MFLFYSSIQSGMSYLIQFSMKFVYRYLTGNNTFIVPNACKTWDHKDQIHFVNVPFLLVPWGLYLVFFSPS